MAESSGEVEDYSLTIDGAPLSCSAIYGSYSAGTINAINTTTGAGVAAATIPGGSLNGIGITVGGTNIYGVTGGASTAGTVVTISRYNTVTQAVTTYTGATIVNSGSGILRGGINPVNGIYYYSAANSNGNHDIYAFDTNTNTNIGFIGQLTGFTGGSGDLAFDSSGNLIMLVSGNSAGNENLVRISNIPTTAGTGTLTGTVMAALPVSGFGLRGGIAFAPDGFLYVSTNTILQKINPDTGAIVSSVTLGTSGMGDLATCTPAGTVTLRKSITSRADPSDQFTLTITGGGLTAPGNTGTTSGSAPGLQTNPTAIAGPVVGLPGTTYTLQEAAASGSLTNYSTTLACVDNANGGASITATQVNSSTYTVAFPTPTGSQSLANIVCTFTNVAQPRISLTKALGGNRVNSGDQFQVQIRTGSATGPVVSPLTNATTTGSGATVTPGTGTTGALLATPGTDYFLTETGVNGALLTDYANEVITCTDANGVQTGLPTNAPFVGSQKITPVSGANISCTLTNTPNAPALTLSKSALPTTISGTTQNVSYSFLVTNTGNVPITNLAIGDTFTAPAGPVPTITCPVTTLAAGANTTCTATYTPIQADLDNGTIKNSATATGKDPSSKTVTSNISTATVNVTKAAALTLTKSATTTPSPLTAAGQTVNYSFLVQNTGNVTITGLTINDTFTTPAGPVPTITCPVTTLAPNAQTTCTASVYAVSQADVDKASIVNSATASGKDPQNLSVTSGQSVVTLPITAAPVLSLQKSIASIVDSNADGVTDAATRSTGPSR